MTFLVADIRSYTHFTREHGDEAAARLVDRFAALTQELVAARGGDVVELRGDEALAVFSSPRQAIRAAGDLRHRFATEVESDPSLPLRVGMGLDAGEAVPVLGGYRGGALNLAARLCSHAGPGEVFASQTIVGLAGKLDGFAYLDRGPVQLKGLTDPVRVIQVVAEDEIPPDAPKPALRAAATANLPVQPTPFVGRDQELLVLTEMLQRSDVSLLTLTGPGGIGKTRLALQVAGQAIDSFPDGVFFVSLAAIADPRLIPSAIAGTLGLKEEGGQALVDRLGDYLRDKQILLVLDNFEHLLEAAPMVAELLPACPKLKFLVTSRSLLHLSAEHAYAVSSLSIPDLNHLPELGSLSQYDAVALFGQRAEAAKADFRLTNDNAAAVTEICWRVDGLPLAIELAAARVRLFPPQTLLGRLSRRLELLTGGARDRPTRQQTLRGAIDWSYSLLDPAEQRLFMRLAAFSGGCSLSAAEALCGAGDVQPEVLDGAAALIDQSLLQQAEPVAGEPWFVMLETIREYALERMHESGEAEALQRRHAEYYLALAEAIEPDLRGPAPVEALVRLEREYDNLRAALQWMLESGEVEPGLRLMGALSRFWELGAGTLSEGRRWWTEFLDLDARDGGRSPALRARALTRAATLAYVERNMGDAIVLFEQSLPLLRRLGDHRGLTEALRRLADLTTWHGKSQEAAAWCEEELALAREFGDTERIAQALLDLARMLMPGGDLQRLRQLSEECLELYRGLGDRAGMSGALQVLGYVAQNEGDVEQARRLFEEAVELVYQDGTRRDIRPQLEHLALTAKSRGWYERSIALYGESLRRSIAMGDRREAARARCEVARSAYEHGEYERAAALYRVSLTVYREAKDLWGTAMALQGLGFVASDQGDAECVVEFCGEALNLFRQLGDVGNVAACQRNLALAARHRGDHRRAQTLLEESLALVRDRSQKTALGQTLGIFGLVMLDEGNDRRAEEAFVESLVIGGVGGSPWLVAMDLEGMAGVSARRGQPAQAARLFGVAGALRASSGAPIWPAFRPLFERHLESARAALGEASFNAAWEEGQAMTIAQAIAYALEQSTRNSST